MNEKTNLLEFIGKEENNLLTSLVIFRRDFDGIAKIDGLFQAPGDFLELKDEDSASRAITALYFFSHYHLYFSIATLFRAHLSDSLHSTRKAIDATLTAYRLFEEPNTLPDYYAEHGSYQRITKTILRSQKQKPGSYPLADALIHLHGVCSQYGSHSDISSFIHRMRITPTDKPGRDVIEHLMFQFPSDRDDYRFFVVATLAAFMNMLQVFCAPMVAMTRKDFAKDRWTTAIKDFSKAMQKEMAEQGQLLKKKELQVIVRSVEAWAKSSPQVRRAWVFGSYAKGTAKPESDVDVAVELADESLNGEDLYTYWFNERQAMADRLAPTLEPRLDLQLYAPIAPHVASYVDEHGILAFERSSRSV